MYAAAVFPKERALGSVGFAQPQKVFGPINIAPLEARGSSPGTPPPGRKSSSERLDEAPLPATVGAPRRQVKRSSFTLQHTQPAAARPSPSVFP